MSTGNTGDVAANRPNDAGMSADFTTRDDAGGLILLDAINLYGQLQAVRIGLRVQVNNLTRSVKERKQLYADLRAKEDTLKARIEQLLPHLTLEEAKQLRETYDQEPAWAT